MLNLIQRKTSTVHLVSIKKSLVIDTLKVSEFGILNDYDTNVKIELFLVLKATEQDYRVLNEKIENEDLILRLEGLPWTADKDDIRKFFSGKFTHHFHCNFIIKNYNF